MKKGLIFLFVLSSLVCAASGFVWKTIPAGNGFSLELEIKAGGSVYSSSVICDITDADGKKLVPEKSPKAQESYGAGKWYWQFKGKAPFSGTVEYQGCGKSADGEELCYPPEKVNLFSQQTREKKNTSDSTADMQFKVVKSVSGYMSKEKFLAFLGESGTTEKDASRELGIAAVFLLALLGGLGLNLTPCILPMIPINLAIIGAAGSGRKSGFLRGLCYGCGMAFAYGVLGVVVVLSGAPFGSLNSSWIFNFIIGAVFFILAVAMAGFINLDFSRYRRFDVSKWGRTREAAAFFMGGVSALLAGACVAPVVVTVLLFAASSYNDGNFFALFLPFSLGVGMALPWPFAGAGLAVLPRPNGKIMNLVKVVFVVLIAAAGTYYFYTGWKLLQDRNNVGTEFDKLENVLSESRKNGKSVLVDFWAPWCKNCLAMEKEVLSTPEVKAALEKYNFVKFNAQDIRDERVLRLLEKCRIPGLPGYAVLEVGESR